MLFSKSSKMTIIFYLNALCYGCSEGQEGKCAKSKALLSKGDTDNGNAKSYADQEVYKSKLRAAKEDPDKVHNGMAVKISLHTATEGPDSIACDLDKLKAEGDADDSNAERDTYNEVNNCHPKAVNQEPDKIANKLHIYFLLKKKSLTLTLYHKEIRMSIACVQ